MKCKSGHRVESIRMFNEHLVPRETSLLFRIPGCRAHLYIGIHAASRFRAQLRGAREITASLETFKDTRPDYRSPVSLGNCSIFPVWCRNPDRQKNLDFVARKEMKRGATRSKRVLAIDAICRDDDAIAGPLNSAIGLSARLGSGSRIRDEVPRQSAAGARARRNRLPAHNQLAGLAVRADAYADHRAELVRNSAGDAHPPLPRRWQPVPRLSAARLDRHVIQPPRDISGRLD